MSENPELVDGQHVTTTALGLERADSVRYAEPW
jgi:hypothetical protein